MVARVHATRVAIRFVLVKDFWWRLKRFQSSSITSCLLPTWSPTPAFWIRPKTFVYVQRFQNKKVKFDSELFKMKNKWHLENFSFYEFEVSRSERELTSDKPNVSLSSSSMWMKHSKFGRLWKIRTPGGCCWCSQAPFDVIKRLTCINWFWEAGFYVYILTMKHSPVSLNQYF